MWSVVVGVVTVVIEVSAQVVATKVGIVVAVLVV